MIDAPEEMERVGKDLEAVRAILAKVPSLHRILGHPGIPLERRKALLDETLGRLDAHPAARGAVLLLLEQRALASLGPVVAAYGRIKERRLGIASAVVTTAVPVPEEEKPAWQGALARVTRTRVQIDFKTDPSLIGGAVAQVGSVLYDGSVRGSLERIRQSLRGE